MGWKGIAFMAAVLVVWFVLNRWVLPRYGYSTCCCPTPPAATQSEAIEQKGDAL